MNSYVLEDSVAELLRNTTSGDDDIPVIQREREPVVEYPASNGYRLGTNTSVDGINSDKNGVASQLKSNATSPQVASHLAGSYPSAGLDINGASTNPIEDYQLVSRSKQLAYPPIQGLSESVLPPSLSIHSLGSKNPAAAVAAASNYSSMAADRSLPKKRKEATGPKTRPAFVMKIWSMVNDPANNQYIRWNEDGKSFHVFHREEFMKQILPKYFKHNNFASFVRQLNMYGWHKVQDVNNGLLYNQGGKDGDKSGLGTGDEIWQFENPYFIRDREDLLDKIQRNRASAPLAESPDPNLANFQLILNELDQIKLNQIAISEDLRRVRKDNKTLWHENFLTRERNQQQGQTLEKILTFLATVYGNNNGKISEVENSPLSDLEGALAPYNNFRSSLAQQDTSNAQQQPQLHAQRTRLQNDPQQQQRNQPQQSQQSQQNPFLFDSFNAQQPPPSPYNKPRLMLMNLAYQNAHDSNNFGETLNNGMSSMESNADSVEEIMRSYENTPQPPNIGLSEANTPNALNRMYQQLVNQDHPSPRHFFPELNSINSPYIDRPATPQRQKSMIENQPQSTSQNLQHPRAQGSNQAPPNKQQPQGASNDVMNVLEQNIHEQGQSIKQVQDWIQKLAAQQQELQQNNNNLSKFQQQVTSLQQQQTPSAQAAADFNDNFEMKPDLDEFDVSQFLDSASPAPPSETPANEPNLHKRTIEEVSDDQDTDAASAKRR